MVRRYFLSGLTVIAAFSIMVGLIGCSSSSGGPPPEPPPPATDIKGVVFHDVDSNGIKGIDEEGIAGVLVSNGSDSTATDQNGDYTLPKTGQFVFVTTPGDYTPSGVWYRSTSDSQFSFGLKHTPEKKTAQFTFVHLTDIHLDGDSLPTLNQAVEEIQGISPAFVMATGDFVNVGDRLTISEAQANQWFGAFKSAVSGLDMPVYCALGNHDLADITQETAPGAQPGSSKNAYRQSFGPTYYSFDWGDYHCLVLDPNELNGAQHVYRIAGAQLQWLQQDLSHRAGSPLLVFFHEPTTSWASQSEVLNLLLSGRSASQVSLFAGHGHHDLLTQAQGIPEQVTGAFSGEWWFGPSMDGNGPGYRLVSVKGENISSLYKETGATRKIQPQLPGPVVSGQVELKAQLYSEHGSIAEASYRVDAGAVLPMTVAAGTPWSTASTTWDTAGLAEGFYTITLSANDGVETFTREVSVKVSPNQTVPIGDLLQHFETFQGWRVTIQGTALVAMFGPPLAEVGAWGMKVSDATGTVVVYTGECISPPLPSVSVGTSVRLTVVPLRFSWAFIEGADEPDHEGTFEQMESQLFLMSDVAGAVEKDGSGNILALRLMRLVTAADLTKLS
jgi:hypothetical protein